MNLIYGLLGVLFGLAVAFLANRWGLPYVMEQQRRASPYDVWPVPRAGYDKILPLAQRYTPVMYKAMYVFFPFVFGMVGAFYIKGNPNATPSPAALGAIVGGAFAIVEYVMFGVLIARAHERGETGPGPAALDWVRKIQLVLFPVVGYFVGPYLVEAFGA
jgi:hypothetical protein